MSPVHVMKVKVISNLNKERLRLEKFFNRYLSGTYYVPGRNAQGMLHILSQWHGAFLIKSSHPFVIACHLTQGHSPHWRWVSVHSTGRALILILQSCPFFEHWAFCVSLAYEENKAKENYSLYQGPWEKRWKNTKPKLISHCLLLSSCSLNF